MATYYEDDGTASFDDAPMTAAPVAYEETPQPEVNIEQQQGATGRELTFDFETIADGLSVLGLNTTSARVSVPDATPSLTQSKPAETSWLDGIMGKLSTAYNKNPDKFWEVGLGALGGAYKDEQAKKAKDVEHERSMQKLAQENQFKLDTQEKVNNSFTGIPKARGGIISGALKRTNGQAVFAGNGNMNKA